MTEYEEQLRRAEALLGDEKQPEPSVPKESAEEAPASTETDEEISARLKRELGLTVEKKETKSALEEKLGKLAPEQRAELASKISSYEQMIAQEEAEI